MLLALHILPQALHLSEHAAYGRIEPARVVRRFPELLDMLEDGSVTLTTVSLVAAQLTVENHRELLEMVRHKSKRQVEELLARLRPQPLVPPSVRRLPTRGHAAASIPPDATINLDAASGTDGAPVESVRTRSGPSPASATPSLSLLTTTPAQAHRPTVTPLAPQRYKVQFTASAETVEKLRCAQALLRHQIPDGDPAAILDRALTAPLDALAKQKLAATDRPREPRVTATGSRHIPAAVKRAVWLRDSGRCAFVTHKGRRCTEDGFLEFHHVAPHAAGGEPTVDNIQLRCRAHNGYEAECYFGRGRKKPVREKWPPFL